MLTYNFKYYVGLCLPYKWSTDIIKASVPMLNSTVAVCFVPVILYSDKHGMLHDESALATPPHSKRLQVLSLADRKNTRY